MAKAKSNKKKIQVKSNRKDWLACKIYIKDEDIRTIKQGTLNEDG